MKKIIALLIIGALVMSSGALYAAGDKCDQGEKGARGNAIAARHNIYKDLNLTEEQKKMLEENKAKHKEEMKTLFAAMKETRISMRQELQKETLDMAKINQINDELKKLQAQTVDHRLESVLVVRKILSPDQFKKFMSKMEEKAEHFKADR